MIKVLPLTGLKSLHAFNAYNAVLFGLHLTPAHVGQGEDAFYDWFDALSEAEKEKQIRYAISLAKISEEEIKDLLAFTTDPNGLPYSEVNIGGLQPFEIVELMTAVCMELSKIKLRSISEEAKKKFLTTP